MSKGMKEQEGRQAGKRKCFTWQMGVFIIALGALAGILIWLFAPIDKALDRIIPNNNNTDSEEGETSEPTPPPASPPSPSPTALEAGGYQFFQCTNLTECCNGLSTICDLRVNEVLFATAHNAMSTIEDGFPEILFPNHEFQLERALEAGYRGISLDFCGCGNALQLCHGICNIGARNPAEVLTNIVAFLDANPTETLVLNLQINNDAGDEISLTALYALMQSIDGFIDMVYVQDSQVEAQWPTLRSLVSSNKRILMFHFNGPNSCNNDACPPGLHYWFDYAAETDFEFSDKDDLEDTSSSCQITRGRGNTDFFAINHFITPPVRDDAREINQRQVIEQRLTACSDMNGGRIANLFFVDFWSVGDLLEVTQNYNRARVLQQRRKLLRQT